MVEYLDPWEGNNWPDWTDSQRKIDAVFDNGGIILDGTLVVDDFGFDGEDEVIHHVEQGSGMVRDFSLSFIGFT